MSSTSDEEVARGYLAGEPDSIRQVDRWLTMVVDNRTWGLSHQREDILQEVRRRLVENLTAARFKGDSSLKTYAVQIARYTCIEFLRAKIRQSAVDVDDIELSDSAPNPEQQAAANEDQMLAARALAALPEGCRELFDLIFKDQLHYEVIAKRLRVAPGTVKSRAWRCREALVHKLSKLKNSRGLSAKLR